jgi:hypothetical protein
VGRDFHRRVQLELWSRQHAHFPQIAGPEDWPPEARLERMGLQPLWHGDYSPGLSATFAAVNGIRLLMAGHYRLNDKEEQGLVADAWRWRSLRREVLPDRGLRQGEWVRMVESLCQCFSNRHGAFVTMVQPWRGRRPDEREFFTTLERLIVSQHVVLSLLAGAHYSVVRGYTPTSLLLFDSGDKCWIKRTSIGLIGSPRAVRHRFAAASTLALGRTF